MAAWKTIVQHEFLDKNLENFNASEGTLQTSSPPPRIYSYGTSGGNTLWLKQESSWMKYTPKETIINVIGIQVRCKVRTPHLITIPTLEMFDLGQFKVGMVFHSHNTGKSLEVRYGDQLVTIVNYPSNDLDYFDLEILWLPNGQLRILINGQLELFRNDFGTNTKTTIAKVGIGINPDFVGPIYHAPFFISYVNIKALKELDAASEVLHYFPVKCPPAIPGKCLRKMLDRQNKIAMLFREFMARFSQKHTQNWDEMNDNEQPVSDVAKKAHIKAVKCGMAAKKAFEKPGAGTAKKFYTAFEEFLLYLKQYLPEPYTDMLKKAIEMLKPDPECEDDKNAYYAQLDAATKYKLGLLEEAMKIIISTK